MHRDLGKDKEQAKTAETKDKKVGTQIPQKESKTSTAKTDKSEGTKTKSKDPIKEPALTSAHHKATFAENVQRDKRGKIARSAKAKDNFKKLHPCPSTHRSTGACPGYVIDHVVPLKRGGKDAPENMQWQTVADAKAKDKFE